MQASDVLLVAGVGMLLVAALGSRVSQSVRTHRRWLLLGGVALCLVSAILGFPDLMKGFQDGSR